MPVNFSLRRAIPALLFAGLLSAPAIAQLPDNVDGAPVPTLAPMLKRIMPAVVNISTQTEIEIAEHPLLRDPFFRHFFDVPNQPLKRKSSSLGSGVIVDAKNGYVITNNHVIDKADQITVLLNDGRKLEAKLVGADPESDLAVVKVKEDGLTALNFANSDELRVGDFVVAIGNPFGLGQTATSGIVSALGRTGLGIEGYEDFIQTDASINPGNSGGALVNLHGELVGINTAIVGPSGGNVGIGFAIPSNMAASIKQTLIEHGEVRRGLLGVMVQDITPELAQAFGLEQTQGTVVTGVQPDSPAAKAGLDQGDVLLSVNGKAAKSGMGVRNQIGLMKIGDEVRMEILRQGKTLFKTATIAKLKKQTEDGKRFHPKLAGMVLSSTLPDDNVRGVRIEKIHTASPAFQAGIRPGDIIVSANKRPVRDLDELQAAVDKTPEVLLNVQRGGNAFFVLLR